MSFICKAHNSFEQLIVAATSENSYLEQKKVSSDKKKPRSEGALWNQAPPIPTLAHSKMNIKVKTFN